MRDTVVGKERVRAMSTQFDTFVRILKIKFPDRSGYALPLDPERGRTRSMGVPREWLECRKCYCKYECVQGGLAYSLQVCLDCYCRVAMHIL